MKETNTAALDFYENVYSTAKGIIGRGMPRCVEIMIKAIDKAVLAFEEEMNRNDREVAVNNTDYRRVNTNDLNEILNTFTDRPSVRRNFLRQFPGFKLETESILSELKAEIKELEQLECFEDKRVQCSATFGVVASIMSIASLLNPPSAIATVGMNAVSVAHSLIQAIASYVEHSKTEKHMKHCVELMQKYEREVEYLYRWFTFNECLVNSVKKAIGSKTAENIFKTIKTILDKEPTFNPKDAIRKVSEVLRLAGFPESEVVYLSGALLEIFWINWGSVWMSDWKKAALPFERIKTISEIGANSANVILACRNNANPLSATNSWMTTGFSTFVQWFPVIERYIFHEFESKSSVRVKALKDIEIQIESNLKVYEEAYNHLKAEEDDRVRRILSVLWQFKVIFVLIFSCYCLVLLRDLTVYLGK